MSRNLVLVTGGAGFIGSNIVAELCAEGRYGVVVCDRLEEAALGKWRNIAKHPIADFISPEAMYDWLDANAADVEAIVHMGAISSTMEPDADLVIHNNFSLSRDLWNWSIEHGARMIWASSAATYGDGEQGFSGKDDYQSLSALRPLNVYGYSKTLFDLYARRDVDRGRAPRQWAGLKFFNVYGPNEAHKRSMMSVAAQIWPKVQAGEEVSLFKSHRPDYADGGQLRDFVYVKDAARVVAWLVDNPAPSGIFNLGSGKARSFADMARAVFTAAGAEPNISYRPMPVEIRDKYQYFTQADMSRLKAIGYDRPFHSLEEGIGDYVSRYLSQPDPYR
jgi:ADP-L-glycero-D-manno-heptose 6-epimerase